MGHHSRQFCLVRVVEQERTEGSGARECVSFFARDETSGVCRLLKHDEWPGHAQAHEASLAKRARLAQSHRRDKGRHTPLKDCCAGRIWAEFPFTLLIVELFAPFNCAEPVEFLAAKQGWLALMDAV